MKIQVTLISFCCNAGASYGYQLQAALQDEGHEVTFQSRNSHGRGPKQMGLDAHFIPEDLKVNPLLLIQWENGRSLYIPAVEWHIITKKEESQDAHK